MKGRIPDSFIQDIIARTNIVDVIQQRVDLRKKGANYSACCPFHDEKTPSFTVSETKQFYHCFGCGAHGTAITFLMEYDRLTFPDAIENLAHSLGLEVPHEGIDREKVHQYHELTSLLKKCMQLYCGQLRSNSSVIHYLQSRSISAATAANWNLGYAPDEWHFLEQNNAGIKKQLLLSGMLTKNEKNNIYDRFRNRLMIPIKDYKGKVVAFGGRVIGAGEPKYLNSPETPVFNKSAVLFGLFEISKKKNKPDQIIIVEGYMDVIALSQAGVHNAVATLGTAFTLQHLQIILRYSKNIVFCFDGDSAGKKAAWKALNTCLPELRSNYTLHFSFLPEGEDPDSYIQKNGTEKFHAFINSALDLNSYVLASIPDVYDVSSLEGRANAGQQLAKLYNTIPDALLKDILLNQIADYLHVDKQLLNQGKQEIEQVLERKKNTNASHQTPVRNLIALLFVRPEFTGHIPDNEPALTLPSKGLTFLTQLLAYIRENNPGPAALVEHYRATSDFDHINSLLQQLPRDEDTYETEFFDSLHKLRQAYNQERYSGLLEKLAQGTISEEEKQELTQFRKTNSQI